jgi:hypothetical protein
MNSTAETETSVASIELAKYLWEEYRYRHDLIWRLLFRMTAVAALLSIAPFTIDDLVKRQVGAWVDVLPGLALAFVVISWPVLYLELKLFEPIDRCTSKLRIEQWAKRSADRRSGTRSSGSSISIRSYSPS